MPAPPAAWKRLTRNVVPWLVAAVALWWVFHAVKWTALLDAFAQARWLPTFLGASALLLWVNCAADCMAMSFTFRWFGVRLPYREIFIVRGATYLLAVIQYYVGQAAIIGFLHERRGVPGWRAAGFILFISGINLAVLVVLTAFGLSFGATPVAWLRLVPVTVGVGALLYGLVLWLQPAPLKRLQVLAPLFEMGVVGHLKALAVRLPHVLVIIAWHYLGLRCFRVDVPLLDALIYLPAVFFIAALPVSPQGLGLSQGAAVTFFARYAPGGEEAAVLAYSLAMTGVALMVQVTMGLLFLPAARRLGVKGDEGGDDGATAPLAEVSDG